VPGKQAESEGDRFRSRVCDASVMGWRMSNKAEVKASALRGIWGWEALGGMLTLLLSAKTYAVLMKAAFDLVGD
jgi:hypothetical protein